MKNVNSKKYKKDEKKKYEKDKKKKKDKGRKNEKEKKHKMQYSNVSADIFDNINQLLVSIFLILISIFNLSIIDNVSHERQFQAIYELTDKFLTKINIKNLMLYSGSP